MVWEIALEPLEKTPREPHAGQFYVINLCVRLCQKPCNVLLMSLTTDCELKYSFNLLALSILLSAHLSSALTVGIVLTQS